MPMGKQAKKKKIVVLARLIHTDHEGSIRFLVHVKDQKDYARNLASGTTISRVMSQWVFISTLRGCAVKVRIPGRMITSILPPDEAG